MNTTVVESAAFRAFLIMVIDHCVDSDDLSEFANRIEAETVGYNTSS